MVECKLISKLQIDAPPPFRISELPWGRGFAWQVLIVKYLGEALAKDCNESTKEQYVCSNDEAYHELARN